MSCTVIELIQADVTRYPFHQKPPTYVRAHRYRYWFTEPKEDGLVILTLPLSSTFKPQKKQVEYDSWNNVAIWFTGDQLCIFFFHNLKPSPAVSLMYYAFFPCWNRPVLRVIGHPPWSIAGFSNTFVTMTTRIRAPFGLPVFVESWVENSSSKLPHSNEPPKRKEARLTQGVGTVSPTLTYYNNINSCLTIAWKCLIFTQPSSQVMYNETQHVGGIMETNPTIAWQSGKTNETHLGQLLINVFLRNFAIGSHSICLQAREI